MADANRANRAPRMQAVGIGGKDLAEGNPKLTLAIIWQLMRADVLQVPP